MYLFVWIDGSHRQVTENLAAADLLGVQAGTLSIFRLNSDRGRFEKLVLDRGISTWLPVLDARVVTSGSARLHLA